VVLAPESVFARRMRGFAYAAAERYSEAIADFDHVLAIDPTSDGVQVSRAHCFVNMDEYSQAIRAFTQAITTDPQDATAWGGRGLAHYLADEPRQALVDLDRAITLSPNDQTYLQARASCYLELDQYDASLSDLDAAVGAKRAAIAARRLRWIVRRVRASDDGSQPPSQPEIPEMTEVVRNAIDSAVADLKSVALDTRALLVELMRVDTDPEWRHIRELCGDEDVIEASSTRDPVESFRLVWNIPAVTYTCEIALRASVEMAARYGLGPVSSGVLLLALLGDGTSAAGQALLAGGASHDEVVVAASELLGQELEDLDLGNSNTGGS
jgi:tetratricopeptide (TPR) repeat protein